MKWLFIIVHGVLLGVYIHIGSKLFGFQFNYSSWVRKPLGFLYLLIGVILLGQMMRFIERLYTGQ